MSIGIQCVIFSLHVCPLIFYWDYLAWSISKPLTFPSLETLKTINPSDSSLEVVFVDRRSDPSLRELQNRVQDISCCCIETTDVVDQLAKLVCNCMGWFSLALLALNYLACTSLTMFYCCNKGLSFCMGRWSFSYMEGAH